MALAHILDICPISGLLSKRELSSDESFGLAREKGIDAPSDRLKHRNT